MGRKTDNVGVLFLNHRVHRERHRAGNNGEANHKTMPLTAHHSSEGEHTPPTIVSSQCSPCPLWFYRSSLRHPPRSSAPPRFTNSVPNTNHLISRTTLWGVQRKRLSRQAPSKEKTVSRCPDRFEGFFQFLLVVTNHNLFLHLDGWIGKPFVVFRHLFSHPLLL